MINDELYRALKKEFKTLNTVEGKKIELFLIYKNTVDYQDYFPVKRMFKVEKLTKL